MLLSAFTACHVILSLIGIATGVVVLYGWTTARSFERWITIFLITTIATSVTGFLFPFHKFMPSHALGILSLLVLAVALAVRYKQQWRRTFLVTSTLALFLNFFVLIAQLFQKVPALNAFAPTQSEPPFLATELLALILFAAAGTLAVTKRSREAQ